jgi:hypothetical protein
MFTIKQANSTQGMTEYTERLFGDDAGGAAFLLFALMSWLPPFLLSQLQK